MNDFADLLADPDFVAPLDILRSSEVVGDNGRLVDQAEISVGILASVQPSTPEDRATLPEAVRDSAALTLWTTARLDLWHREGSVRFQWGGLMYRLQGAEPWPQGDYVRGIATLEGVQS